MIFTAVFRKPQFLAIVFGMLFMAPPFPAAAHMAPSHGGHADSRFDQMDINRDGRVILEEFQTAFPNMSKEAFAVIDLNKDGAIEREEWLQFSEGHAKGDMPGMRHRGAPMNNMPGDPLIPPPDSADLPLMRPPLQ